MYKRLNPDVDVEALNWRVIVAGPRPTITVQPPDGQPTPMEATRKGERPAYFPETAGYINLSGLRSLSARTRDRAAWPSHHRGAGIDRRRRPRARV